MNIFQRWHQDNLEHKQLKIDTRREYLASQYRLKVHSMRVGAERAQTDIRNHERMSERRRLQASADRHPHQRDISTRATVTFHNSHITDSARYINTAQSYTFHPSYYHTGARPPKKVPPKVLSNPNLPDI